MFPRVARAAKRPVMWALPVLRTRGYLAAAEFHAHAASLGSLSPCDLYLVNLGSVVRCETSIRTPPSPATVILRTSSAAAPALERERWLAVVGAVAKGIRRMRDLYRAGAARGERGRSEAVAAPIDSWGYSSSGHCCSSYVPSEPVFSVHRTARHTLVKPAPTREVATNKLLFFTANATVTAAQPSNLYVKININQQYRSYYRPNTVSTLTFVPIFDDSIVPFLVLKFVI